MSSPFVLQPGLAALGGAPNQPLPPWVRMPFFPTAPFYSTNPNVGTTIRFYSVTVLSTDSDVTVGAESLRNAKFDIPCRIIAINGSCVNTAANGALPVGVDPRDCFLFRAAYSTGERLHVSPTLGSTVLGTADRPGELGSTGFSIDAGGTLECGITPINPIPTNFRIDIVFHVLEIRGSANLIGGR